VFPGRLDVKAPWVTEWQERATTDKSAIEICAQSFPGMNVCVACGPSDLCVYDADHGLKDEADFLAWRKNGEFAELE
jgi:hypothetical protein